MQICNSRKKKIARCVLESRFVHEEGEREARTACVSCGRVAILGDPGNGSPPDVHSAAGRRPGDPGNGSPPDVHSAVGRRPGDPGNGRPVDVHSTVGRLSGES